jgi:tagatose-1,6-bisphosphate aldolase non-catalytic subunit AgaZ/GatZ
MKGKYKSVYKDSANTVYVIQNYKYKKRIKYTWEHQDLII